MEWEDKEVCAGYILRFGRKRKVFDAQRKAAIPFMESSKTVNWDGPCSSMESESLL